MSRQLKPYVSPQEYLDLERQAENKHEYVDGEICAWAGASRKHNLIAGNIITSLTEQLRGKPCEVYPGEMRVKAPASRAYVYPDVVVVSDDPHFEDDYLDTLLNPTVVFEVLSKSTESYNRLAKSAYYRTIESLSEYLLVAQEEYRVEQYVKQGVSRWLLTEVRSLDATIELESIKCSLALREIYDRISIEPEAHPTE